MPKSKTTPPMNRRNFLVSGAVSGAALTAASTTHAATSGDSFTYEIQRSDDEWRAMLSDFEYKILREFDTELPHTSPLAKETADGVYHCKGCELASFSSNWKVPIDKGWVFFAHSEDNAVLTSIDGPQQAYGMNPNGFGNLVEIHCRRCGSHLGHQLIVTRKMVYCINGTALTFVPNSA